MAFVVAAAASAIAGATAAITTGLTAIGLSAGAAAAVVGFGVQAVGTAALTAGLEMLTPKVSMGGSSREWRADTDAGLPFAFGRVAAAGVINHMVSYDATNRYKSIFATLSRGGPINSYVRYEFDDEVTTFDGTYNKATNGDHSGAMWLQRKLGTQPQTALTTPTGAGAGIAAPGWTTNHKMSGAACYVLTMYENSKLSEFRGGEPRTLIVFEGLKCWDPRLDSTYPGGSGSSRLLDPSTWTYTTNGALHALKWATGIWEGASGGGTYGKPYACSLVGGIGATLDSIDVAALVNAANVADANGWTCAAYPNTKDDKWQVYAALLQSAGAMPCQVGGKISCVTRGEAQASVVTVTAADTAGPIEIALMQSRLERRNTGTARYWSEAHRWEMTPIEPVTNAAWVADDGGSRGVALDYPYVPEADQAAQLIYYDLADAREAITGTVPFKSHMRRIAPGDCFTFDEPGFQLDGVKVKCLKRSYDPMSGMVKITFRQETDAKHDDAMGRTGTTPPDSDPDDPLDTTVDPPTGFGSSVSGNNVTLTWTNGEAFYFRTLVYQSPTSDFADAVQVASAGGDPGAMMSVTFAPGAGDWWYWVVSRSVFFDFSTEVGPEAVTVIGVISTDLADASDLLRRSGGGVYTGDLAATDDTAVTALETDLLSGAVKPAEAVTFTGKGDLAEKNTADTADLAPNAATKPGRYDSSAQTDWVASGIATSALTTRTTVFTATVTATGAEIQITGGFDLRMQHSQDDVVLHLVVERLDGSTPVDVFYRPNQSLAVSGDGFINWWQPINFSDTPPAGSVTYYVRVYHTYTIGSPGGFVTWKHRNRTMAFLETKR